MIANGFTKLLAQVKLQDLITGLGLNQSRNVLIIGGY